MQIIRMLQVVFELETTAPVTWSPADVTSGDDGDVSERQNAEDGNAERIRCSSNSSGVLLLKGEMKYVESLRVVIFLCKPLYAHRATRVVCFKILHTIRYKFFYNTLN